MVKAIFHILFQRDVYSIISALTGVGQDSVQIKFLMVNDREGGVSFQPVYEINIGNKALSLNAGFD